MKILSKLNSWIDRDKPVIKRKLTTKTTDHHLPEYHEMANIVCGQCKAPRLYRVGTEYSYTLHCFRCDKVEQVVVW
jgi:hypothetical protein